MTAEIIQIRDFQNKKDIERLYETLQPFTETTGFTGPSEPIPYGGKGIDGMWTDTDPA